MQEPGESSIFAEKFDTMEIAVFKTKGNKETIVKNELELAVKAIREGQYRDEVAELRQIYPLIRPTRDDDGRMQTAFSLQFRLELPRLCFAATWQNLKGEPRLTGYNGLVVLEANNLADYDEAIGLRNAAARMPQTLLTFLGASGRSVKIVCRGELFPEQTVAAGQGGADGPAKHSLPPNGVDKHGEWNPRDLFRNGKKLGYAAFYRTLATTVARVATAKQAEKPIAIW